MKSLVSLCAAGGSETVCYICEGLSFEMILRIKQKMLHPYIDFEKFGKRIELIAAAEMEQKGIFSFSVVFDLDSDKVEYYNYDDRRIALPAL